MPRSPESRWDCSRRRRRASRPSSSTVEELADVSTVEAAQRRRPTSLAARFRSSSGSSTCCIHGPVTSSCRCSPWPTAGVTLSNDLAARRGPITDHVGDHRRSRARQATGNRAGDQVGHRRGARRSARTTPPITRLLGVATSAGMGFTVALFITELAFTDRGTALNATLGIVARGRHRGRIIVDHPDARECTASRAKDISSAHSRRISRCMNCRHACRPGEPA